MVPAALVAGKAREAEVAAQAWAAAVRVRAELARVGVVIRARVEAEGLALQVEAVEAAVEEVAQVEVAPAVRGLARA